MDAPFARTNDFADVLAGLCQRLEEALENENASLRRGDMREITEHARRKELLLLDIMRLTQRHGDEPPASLRDRLATLQERLRENARLLQMQLRASRELAQYMEEGIRRQESDGTYSPGSLRSSGGAPWRGGGGYGAW